MSVRRIADDGCRLTTHTVAGGATARRTMRDAVRAPVGETVNDVLLDRQLPEPASAHRFEVIVCVSAEREQRQTEFCRLKGNQAVDQTYRTKLAELEGRHAATVQERDRLLHERDEARKQVEEWAHQAAARKPDEVSGTYKAAFRLFADGKTEPRVRQVENNLRDLDLASP
jgi:hypothetical protein